MNVPALPAYKVIENIELINAQLSDALDKGSIMKSDLTQIQNTLNAISLQIPTNNQQLTTRKEELQSGCCGTIWGKVTCWTSVVFTGLITAGEGILWGLDLTDDDDTPVLNTAAKVGAGLTAVSTFVLFTIYLCTRNKKKTYQELNKFETQDVDNLLSLLRILKPAVEMQQLCQGRVEASAEGGQAPDEQGVEREAKFSELVAALKAEQQALPQDLSQVLLSKAISMLPSTNAIKREYDQLVQQSAVESAASSRASSNLSSHFKTLTQSIGIEVTQVYDAQVRIHKDGKREPIKKDHISISMDIEH